MQGQQKHIEDTKKIVLETYRCFKVMLDTLGSCKTDKEEAAPLPLYQRIYNKVASWIRPGLFLFSAVLILCSDGESLKGSGRSVPEFDLHAGLTRCADMLLGFGGHRQAAGLRIAPGRLDELRERFDAVIREELGEAPLTPSLKIDAEMPFSQASDFTVLKGLELLQPFGIGNPEPIFASLPLRVKKRKAFGHSREHISLEVTEEGSGITLQAKAWRQADQIPESIQGQRIRLAYTPGINAYNGIASVELRVRDWEVL